MKLIIECEVKARWVSQLVGMLKNMEMLGDMGGSRKVAIYSDGDGDFRPKFKFKRPWFRKVPEPAKPTENKDGNTVYDAG